MASRGHSSSRCVGLSLLRPLLLRSTGSRRAGSVVVAHGPSCSAACGILPDQGSNPCPLRWQADSQPLRHQGSPRLTFVFLMSDGTFCCVFFFNDTATTEIYTLSLHDALPISGFSLSRPLSLWSTGSRRAGSAIVAHGPTRSTACGIFPEIGRAHV